MNDWCHFDMMTFTDSIPDKDTAMSLAAPSVAVANQPPTVGHTAPLLPTPPSVLGFPPGLAAAAASVQSALVSYMINRLIN